MEYIIFDTETNGGQDTSLLSIAAIRVKLEGTKLKRVDTYERYYFKNPDEWTNPFALKVHGLRVETIAKMRKDIDYPRYFSEDISDFIEFCKGVKGFIAHNLPFDRSFLPFTINSGYCTLSGIRKKKDYTGKNRKLPTVADYYNIEVESSKLHGSMYDTEVLYKVVKKMLENNDGYIDEYIEETRDISDFSGDDLRVASKIESSKYSFTYNKKEYNIVMPVGRFDRSDIINQVEDATNHEIILNKELLRKGLKKYQNPSPDYMYRDEAKRYLFNNISDFVKGKTIQKTPGVKASSIEEISIRSGLVSLTIILGKVNAFFPSESKLTTVAINNNLASRGVLSKEKKRSVINNNSYDFGIISVMEMDDRTGEVKEYIKYTDRGKRFILDNIEWILGGKEELNKSYLDIPMLEERPEYIVVEEDVSTKEELVRKEINLENLKESIIGASIVVTGKHEVYKRKDLQGIIERSGGIFSKGINQQTDLLVIGEKAGSKVEKAEKLGIPVVEIDKFISLVKG